jgi:transposase
MFISPFSFMEGTFTVKNLDHLGIIAGLIDELGIVEEIDILVPTHRKVSIGTMIKALIINAMGFSQHALYITPRFFEECPVEHLLGVRYAASDFNDDSIGRCLDALFSYGLNKIFVRVAHRACEVAGLKEEFHHVDTTNFSVEGAYEGDLDGVKIRHGYAKDKRFDLKQVTLGLITSYQTAIPRYMQVFDGNASDKETLVTMIQNFVSCFKEGDDVGIFISDSGIYSADNIKEELKTIDWITRVPESIKSAKELVENTQYADLQPSTSFSGYRYKAIQSDYGGVAQRWLLLESEPLAQAVRKTYNEKVKKEIAQACQKIERKQVHSFKEATELSTWMAQLAQKYPLVAIDYTFVEEKYYTKRGKPKAENLRYAQKINTFSVIINTPELEKIIERKSRFILTTNVLDTKKLGNERILEAYKSQASSVENGFSFLKDPIFFAESFFVKKPSRLEGLLMIMAISLLVYSLGERKLRSALVQNEEMILNQIDKPTNKPTLRVVFNIFRGIHWVKNNQNQQFCTNLNENRKKIIALMGTSIVKYYFFDY